MQFKQSCLLTTFTVLVVLLSFKSKAQNTSPSSTYLNNFVQPPPNAASLGKYADFPVGYYTGVPNINIPLYTLKDGSIDLPISISYHASGIKVSELASWVGLGWALNATGMISRTVRGAPDEGSRSAAITPYGPRGYYADYGWFGATKPQFMPYPGPDNYFTDQEGVLAAQNVFYSTVTSQAMAGGADYEPDLYTFNFNGHAGKFVFDEQRNVRLLEDDNLKIKVNFNSTSNYFDTWVITDENGIQYYFGENGAHEIVVPIAHGNYDSNSNLPSNWYLTKIVNPNTKETVVFNYAPEGYSYYDLGPESTLYGGGSGRPIVTSACDNSNVQNNGLYLITTNVIGLRLTSIVTNNFTVKFVAQTPRLDVFQTLGNVAFSGNGFQAANVWNNGNVGSVPANSLDSIKIYSNLNNACLKQIFFNHSYFTSPSTTSQYVTNFVPTDVTDTKRLKLSSVTEISGDGTAQKTPYVFTYNESITLPRRLSYDQDHWGFSNNAAGNNNNYFTPPVKILSLNGPAGANRHAKFPEMSAFTLTSVQDPLGVSTSFTYEQNSAWNGVDSYTGVTDTLIGGLRIKKIAVTDNVTGTNKYREFSYNQINSTQPGGILTRMPVYIMVPYNKFFSSQAVNLNIFPETISGGYAASYPYPGSTPSVIYKQSMGIVPMQDANGNHIVYPYVRETFGLHGEDGYKMYSFDTNSYGDPTNTQTNSRIDFSNYTQGAYMPGWSMAGGSQGSYTMQSGYYGIGNLNDTIANPQLTPTNLNYSIDHAECQNAYPFVPPQVDFKGGKLLEEDTYDSSSNLIISVTNQYTTSFHENFWIRGMRVCFPLDPVNYPYNGLSFYKLHTGISHLTSTTKKTYNGSSYVTETTNYSYDSPYHTLETSETTTSSQGDTYIKQNYYSFDYANSATADNIFGKMKARHMLEPVNTSTWKNGSLVDAKITKFQDFATAAPDTLIYPASIYASETVNPLTPAQANETTAWSSQQTALIPNTTYYKAKVGLNYDYYNGKLINQQLTANINHAVVWDTHLSVPIAVVDNSYNQAHTVATNNSFTYTANVTLPSSGGSSQYTFPFTVSGTSSSTATLSFSGNPNSAGNPTATVNCRITGTLLNGTSYDSGSVQLCICAGTGSCSGGTNTKPMGTLSPGSYVLTASYAFTPTLYCPVSVSATYPVVTTTYSTTGPQQFYYQGFEQSAVTNASPGVFNAGTAHTGTNFWTGAYTVNFTPPADGRTYKITYWYLTGGVWTLMPEQTYTGPTMALTGGTAYDDIRIFPSDAQMTTYTYDNAGNVTSSMDAKGLTTYYEYDAMQRLMNVRDKDRNIVKHIDYHYHGQ